MFLADFHQGLVAVGLAALKQLQRKGCIGQALAGPLRCKLGTPKEIICLQIISNLCALHVDRTSLFPLFLLVCVLARILCNREAALVKASCAWRRITNLCSMSNYEHNKDAVFEDVRSIQCEESAWLSLELGHTMVLQMNSNVRFILSIPIGIPIGIVVSFDTLFVCKGLNCVIFCLMTLMALML